jgi:hypothetical protein
MIPLTKEQQKRIKPLLIPNGVPVRFQEDGQTCDIVTGQKQKKGITVIYQLVYWHFTKELAKEIAKLTGTKAVFDEE